MAADNNSPGGDGGSPDPEGADGAGSPPDPVAPRRPRRGLTLLATGLVLASATAASAQTSPPVEPGAVHEHSANTQRYYEQQQQLEAKPVAPHSDVTNRTQAAEHPAPAAAGPVFHLRKVETNPSAILSADEIAAVTAAYVGREVHMADLTAMVAQINALYARKGFVTARAVLPPQKVENGIVRVQLVEGRVGRVSIEPGAHTRDTYVQRRIPLQPGDLVQLQRLEDWLTYFNRTNDVRARAVLEPGAQLGTTDVKLDLTSPENSTTSFFFDNAGYDSIGRRRVGFSQRWASLSGHRDPLAAGGYWAAGTIAGYASYDYPVTVRGTRLGAAFSYDRIQVRSGPLAPLGVKGRFYDASLRWSRPLAVSRTLLFEASVAPHYQRSVLESSSVPISRVLVKSLVLGGDLQAVDRHGVWVLQNSLTLGSHNLGGTNSFAKDNLAVTRWEPLGAGFVAMFRADGQGKIAGSARLPPSEQLQIGGLSSVRGYPEGELVGDSGYLFSAELDAPLPLGDHDFHGVPLKDRFKLAVFVDHGAIIGAPGNRYATGVGAGLIINLSRYLTGRLNLATPLQDRSGLDRWAFEFYLQTSPDFARIFGGRGARR